MTAIKYEIEANGIIYKVEHKDIFDEGTFVGTRVKRTPFNPDEDLNALPDDVKPYALLKWTPEIIAAYIAKKAADMAALESMAPVSPDEGA